MAIDTKLKRMPRTVRVGVVPGGLSEFITIQAAIDWCATQAVPAPAAATRYTVEVWPGTYTGPVVMADYVDVVAIGTREDTVITRTLGAHDLATVTGALTDLKGFKVISDGAAGAFRARCLTNATNGFRFLDCEFIPQNTAINALAVVNTANMIGYRTPIDILAAATDALNLSGGITYLDDVDLGGNINSVHMHTVATTLHIHKGSLLCDVTTAGAVIQTLIIDYCDLNGATFTLGATGACVYWFERNTGAGSITDASLLGAGTIHYMDVAGMGLTKNGTTPWNIWTSYLLSVNNANAVGAINIYGGQLHGCGGSVGVVLWYIPALRQYQVIAGMQIAHALADMAAGDIIRIGPGTFALAAQLARAIDDVKIIGNGLGTRITLDGVTPVITAGVRDGWLLADFDVDAGLVEIQFATNSTLHNITVNGLHGTIINPDLGQTNFPGQPIVRTDEDRPLNPLLSVRRKDYTQREYQLYDPIFANPYFIMRLLERQGRTVEVSPNAGWTDGSTGGTVTIDPLRIICNTTAVAGRDGLAYCVAAFINSYFGAGSYDAVDWNNKIIIAFDVVRTQGSHADLRGRVQLKQVNTEGILAALGIGLEIQNYALYGETYGAARSTVSLGLTMTATYTYRIRIELFPGEKCDFYVNDILLGSITTVANLPSGLAGATSYLVVSMDNAAQAVDSTLVCSPIIIWNHL